MKPLVITFTLGCLLLSPAVYAEKGESGDVVSMKFSYDGDSHWMKIRLYNDEAPKHVENFKKLVASHFYEGMAFHRVIPGFLVQTGDPLTRDPENKKLWGTGGVGYNVPPEIGRPHRRGSVGMARLQGGNPKKLSSGSQFYVMLANAPQLDGGYTVFGEVIEGLDVLSDMSRTRVDTNDVPLERVEVEDCKLGEPGLVATMTKPISSLKAPSLPNIPNPLSMLKNPFRKKDSGEVAAEIAEEMDRNANASSNGAVEEKVMSSPPPPKADPPTAIPPPEGKPVKEKKKGPFTRLFEKVW